MRSKLVKIKRSILVNFILTLSLDQHTFIIGIDTHIKCSNHIVSKHTKVEFRIVVYIIWKGDD